MKSINALEMRALSIMQPWADCIIFHGKNIENRSWTTKKRGYIAIHASARVDKARYEIVREEYGLKLNPEDASFGAIIGFAKIVDVVDKKTINRKTKKWFMGDYGL